MPETPVQTKEVADALLNSVRRIENLVTIIARQSLRDTISAELRDATALTVYGMTGQHTVREISAATGMATGTISKLWTRWESLGLLQKGGQRYRRTFDSLSSDERRPSNDKMDTKARRPTQQLEDALQQAALEFADTPRVEVSDPVARKVTDA